MPFNFEGPDATQTQNLHSASNGDLFHTVGLYASGENAPIRITEGQPLQKGRELLIPIHSNDGIKNDERIYGLHIPANFDPSRPTRLIIAAHGTTGGGKDAANPIMENELDPEGHAQNNPIGDNIVYVDPIGRNEVVHTVLGQTPVQSWRTPGINLLPDEGKGYPNDLKYVHDVITDAEKRINDLGSSVYMKQAFGFSDGGRMLREYNCAYPGELSYVESDHGTSLGNDKQCIAQTPTTIVVSGPTYEFPVPPGGSVDALVPTVPMLGIGDRMLPPEGKVGDVSALFNTAGFEHSQPLRQVDESLVANKCVGDPKVINGDGKDGHGTNTVETTWNNCAGGYVKLVREYLDPEHNYAAAHAVNDIHNGVGGMPVVGTRSDNNEVAAFRLRSDDIAKAKLLAMGIKF